MSICGMECRNVGAGTRELLTDKQKLATTVGGLSLLALGVYGARESTKVGAQVFRRCVCQSPAIAIA